MKAATVFPRHLLGALLRTLFRIVVLAVALVVLFVIANDAYDDSRRWGLFVGLVCVYAAFAYIILPAVVHALVVVTRRGRIPGRAFSTDGLPADPVNVVLSGTANDLRAAFRAAGWIEAQRLTLRSAIKVATCFVLDRPYPDAPFSPLVLFGRRQDHGFQEPIGHSPRKRNHVRFWAAPHDMIVRLTDLRLWTSRDAVDPNERCLWAGTASEDLGFGLTRLTFQPTHRIDHAVDGERTHVMAALAAVGRVEDATFIDPGKPIEGGYVSDGRIACAVLVQSTPAASG
ncbi:MAG: LssY C-terminal domain-containing protein [Bauldia sp.]